MKCMTCQADIPPQWVSAINKNVCPGCDGPIMGEETQQLISELREAMKLMPNDPEGLAGWLVSNFHLQKYGTAEPTNFHRSKKQEHLENPHLKINDNNPVQQMLQRTGLKKNIDKSKASAMAALAKKINQGELDASEQFEPTEEELEGIEENLDYVETQRPVKLSSALVSDDDASEVNANDVRELEQGIEGARDKNISMSDEIAELQRRDRLRRQSAIASGSGAFRRGG